MIRNEQAHSELLEDAINTNDPLKIYRAHAQHRLLSSDEERELGKRIRSGDDEARNTLITHNLRLVIALVMRYNWSDLLLADLIQEGNLGLIRAADRFDPDLGIRFSTYATYWIRNKILAALVKRSHVKIPEKIRKDLRGVAKTEQKLVMYLGRQPTDKEIAEKLEISTERVTAVRKQFFVYSLDAQSTEDQTLHDTIKSEGAEPDNRIRYRDQIRMVERLLGVFASHKRIPPKKARALLAVLERIYGLNGHSPMPIPGIAAELGITVGEVTELHRKAITLMQREARSIAPEGLP